MLEQPLLNGSDFVGWSSLFDRDALKILDIGCGSGRFLLNSAMRRPEADHLGIELNLPLVQKAVEQAQGFANLRFINGDAVSCLQDRFSAHFLDEIHVYHPQPYLDPLENAYGMLTPHFLARVWTVLKPTGSFFLQTDSRPYAKYLLEAVHPHFEVELQPGPWPDAPEGRTLREYIAMRKQLMILRMRASPRPQPIDIPEVVPYFERGGIRTRHVRKRAGAGKAADENTIDEKGNKQHNALDPYGFQTDAEEISESRPVAALVTALFVLSNLLCAGCEGAFSVFCMVNAHKEQPLADDIGAGLIIAGPAFICVGIAIATFAIYLSVRRWWAVIAGTVVGGTGGFVFWFLSFFVAVVWKVAYD